ncbi:MAG: HEAT repeat domain-containing protein [Phycisphaerales bacterium]|nr:HEAT repeat domain-containing protein [Phycisphaerales bacterium]
MLAPTLLLTAVAGGVTVPDGITVSTWAEHPTILDPVSFCFDERGTIYVGETQRQDRGVEDNRNSPFWLIDDLASRTVDDRYRLFEKWAHKRENGVDFYRKWADEVIRLRDTNGDGVADERILFAGPFDEVLDGTGSGLLALDGDIWYTNIPHLWRLRDRDDDGVADEQDALHGGFGVRVALRGHDMHGLRMGPDGRVYWSIGDRGYHLELPDGRTLEDPHSGAVFRCERDGSKIEVFHRGLRNPQELAFDKYGYLFTGDNNSDSEDRARVVYVAQGGHSGWDMAYQTLEGDNDRGPWVQEELWKMDHPGRPAWVLPPLSYIGSGPSGLTHLPGTGMPARYDDCFLLCDFRGSPEHSGVLSFKVNPDGAGFQVVDIHPFVENILCTDVEVGWDGHIYVSDWVQGWGSTETGRIMRVVHDERGVDPVVTEVAALVREGFDHRTLKELSTLLAHADQRVRLRAQWALADRGAAAVDVLKTAAAGEHQLARIHAMWGLGMIDRLHGPSTRAMQSVQEHVWDDDPEIRGQAARVLGDAGFEPASEDLHDLAFDMEPRVSYHALMGLGKLGHPESIDAVAEVLWTNNNEDPFIRHACVVALAGIGDRDAILNLLGDAQPAVRLGAALALRQMGDEAVAVALRDPDPFIAAEAARAIHDAEIVSAMPALADHARGLSISDTREGRSIGRRVIEAAARRGTPQDAAAVAQIAMNAEAPAIVQIEAARALATWSSPGPRDRVTGRFRRLSPRDPKPIAAAVAAWIPQLAAKPGELGEQGRAAAAALGADLDPRGMLAILQNESASTASRVDCLTYLSADDALGPEAIAAALLSTNANVRAAAMRKAPTAREALALADAAIEGGTLPERRAAIEIIASHRGPDSLASFQDAMPGEVRLDLLEAMRPHEASEDKWQAAIVGGDAAQGRWIVEHHTSASCIRCHQIDGRGGIAGPSLDGVADRLDREALLDSIIDPQKVVLDGYGQVSAMPEMRGTLTPREVRDVVTFLSTCKETPS